MAMVSRQRWMWREPREPRLERPAGMESLELRAVPSRSLSVLALPVWGVVFSYLVESPDLHMSVVFS